MTNGDESPELIVERNGPIATITLNRPERRNALSWALVGEIRSAVAEMRDDDGVRVVVITGSGTKAFCAGADLEGMGGGGDSDDGAAAERHDKRGQLASLFQDLWALGKPTIAKVRGFALAGGMGLALSCDLVIAADDAVFGTPEIDVGLWPFMIGVPLNRSMPPKKALELMMTGRKVDAAEADRLGFVTRVVPADQLDAEVDALAATLATKPPGAMKAGRDAFYGTWDLPADEALARLHPLLSATAEGDEAAEGIAAFLEEAAAGLEAGVIHLDDRGSIAVVTIDRPERRNALDHDALAGFETVLDAVEGGSARAAVLTGADGNFCSGADISGVEDPAFVERLGRVLRRIRELRMPTIAAVDGFCLGAGAQLAVACDLRMATAGSRFGVPAGKLGVQIDWWTVERVASAMGQGAARELLLTADQIPGERAHALGLVQREGDLDLAIAWAESIATLAPITVQGLKAGLNAVEGVGAAVPAVYREAFDRAWASEDLQEGLAAFHARRPPEFHGR